MTPTLLQRFSVLGLILLIASAVTAAIMPSRKGGQGTKDKFYGILTYSTDDYMPYITCREWRFSDYEPNCTHTLTGNGPGLSSTSQDSGFDSNGISSSAPSPTDTRSETTLFEN